MNNENVTICDALNGDAIVFSDLDGTLLDHDGYSFEAAKPALAALAERAIPVVPSTSKTLVELETLSVEIGLSGAAIAENGAAEDLPMARLTVPSRARIFLPPYPICRIA